MTAFAWTLPYQDALRSDPEYLLERIQFATETITARFYKIAFVEAMPNAIEHRALCVALSDLRVLRTSFLHSRRCQSNRFSSLNLPLSRRGESTASEGGYAEFLFQARHKIQNKFRIDYLSFRVEFDEFGRGGIRHH